MTELVQQNINLRSDQQRAMLDLAAELQLALGKRIAISKIARDVIDAGLPLVRQRYANRIEAVKEAQ